MERNCEEIMRQKLNTKKKREKNFFFLIASAVVIQDTHETGWVFFLEWVRLFVQSFMEDQRPLALYTCRAHWIFLKTKFRKCSKTSTDIASIHLQIF